jgi:hypothetical protein
MKQKTFFAKATLAVALAIFSSTAAMGQSDSTATSKGKKVLDKLTSTSSCMDTHKAVTLTPTAATPTQTLSN